MFTCTCWFSILTTVVNCNINNLHYAVYLLIMSNFRYIADRCLLFIADCPPTYQCKYNLTISILWNHHFFRVNIILRVQYDNYQSNSSTVKVKYHLPLQHNINLHAACHIIQPMHWIPRLLNTGSQNWGAGASWGLCSFTDKTLTNEYETCSYMNRQEPSRTEAWKCTESCVTSLLTNSQVQIKQSGVARSFLLKIKIHCTWIY